MNDSENKPKLTEAEQSMQAESLNREGNTCLGLGAGVGVLGTAAAVVTGATCPLCVFVVPTLVGMGLVGKYRAKKILKKPEDTTP